MPAPRRRDLDTEGSSRFDRSVAQLDRLSHRLVALEEISREDLLGALEEFAAAIYGHARSPAPAGRPVAPSEATSSDLAQDHERLLTSVEELRWFRGIVARDDHGGNRQAVGQYGKILAEALRDHRRRGRAAVRSRRVPPPSRAGGPPEQP